MTNPVAIALFSNDLMFSSAVGGAAAAQQAKLNVVSSLSELLKINEAGALALVILDLATPAVDVASVTAQLRALTAPLPTIIAYGPHVHAEKLTAARDAGCDEVLTRGQFHSQMFDVIARHLQR